MFSEIWNFCTMDISISSVNAKVIFVFLLMAITCTVFCTWMIFYLSFYYWLVIFMSISATAWCSTVYFAILSTQAFVNVLLDCNIFDKAEELSVVLNSDIVENNYASIKNLRSRYDKFVVGHYAPINVKPKGEGEG